MRCYFIFYFIFLLATKRTKFREKEESRDRETNEGEVRRRNERKTISSKWKVQNYIVY